MKILRVFPRRTKMTPKDDMVAIGMPDLSNQPEADEVHISVTFTWDIEEAGRLYLAWEKCYPTVRIGGPAHGQRCGPFIAGRYLRSGVTITSRGCPNGCRWCLVKTRFQALEKIEPGHIIQDDNILVASKKHLKRVAKMLAAQPKAAIFSGGLEARRLTEWHAGWLRDLRIRELWFACDSWDALKPLIKAKRKLPDLSRRKMRCYVLIGFGGESPATARQRLERVWDEGFLPMAMPYQGIRRHDYNQEWRDLIRQWSRPAIMFTNHKEEV